MASHYIHTILQPSAVLRRLILSWLCAATLSYLVLPQDLQNLSVLDGLSQMSFAALAIMTCIFFLLFNLWGYFRNNIRIERWLIVCVFTVLSSISICTNFHWAYLFACCAIVFILIVYAFKGWNCQSDHPFSRQRSPVFYKIALLLLGCLFVLFVSVWTVSRV